MKLLPTTLIAGALLLNACSSPSYTGAPFSAGGSGAAAADRSFKIFVANIGDGTITTFESNGSETTPTIRTEGSSNDYLFAMAVGADGRIYALNFDSLAGSGTSGTLTAYKPNGDPTTPTITIPERGFAAPVGIAVDRGGKIYVLSAAHDGSAGIVTSYKQDGSRTKPTFSTGADSSAIAVDANGKIYVTNDTGRRGGYSLTTYLPNGTATTPTITRGLHQPVSVTVGADGTIYVANIIRGGPDGTGAGEVTTYGADGTGPLAQIKTGPSAPGGIAVDAEGRFYLASSTAYASVVKTFTAKGERTNPTIRNVYEPSGIAIH